MQRKYYFASCIALLVFVSTAIHVKGSVGMPGDEENYKLGEGIYYTGESGKRHVPEGYGTLTFRSTDPGLIPDVVIAGTFDGDRILNAVLCQNDTLLFWGDMHYSVHPKKGTSLALDRGELYDGNGNVCFLVTEDAPVTIGTQPDNPAYLRGNGRVWTEVNPVAASRYVLLSDEGIKRESCTLQVDGTSWDVSPLELRFKVGDYLFDVRDYTTGIGKEVSFGERVTSPYEISPVYDPFDRIGRIQGEDLLSTLRFMSSSVPTTKQEKEAVSLENGAWCFRTGLSVIGPVERIQMREYGMDSDYSGLFGFFSSDNQQYSIPYEVCITQPSYEFTCKISRDKLTFISAGTIQMVGETDTYFNPVAPPVTPFSIHDLIYGNRRGAKGGGSGGTLSEGTTATVTLPFLGVETLWTVSASTKEWVTPITTAGTSTTIIRGKKYTEAGDAFPPFRAVRTVTQSVDLNDVAKRTGMSIPGLLVKLFETGLDGIMPPVKDGRPGAKRPWTDYQLASALWQAGGFTTPEEAFDRIIPTMIPENASPVARELLKAQSQGREKALEYCTGQIEKASYLEELTDILGSIYPIVAPDFPRDMDTRTLLFSGLFFSTTESGKTGDSAGKAYRQRVHDKLVSLLSKDNGILKEEFLTAVEALGMQRSPRNAFTYDASQIPTHPVPEIRALLEKGNRRKALASFFLSPTLDRGIQRLPRLDGQSQSTIMRSLTQGVEASVASLRNDIRRDLACNDAEQALQDINMLVKVNRVLKQSDAFSALADDAFATSAKEKAQRLASSQEKDRLALEQDQAPKFMYLSQKYASAPKTPKNKEYIRRFLDLDQDQRIYDSPVTLSPYSEWSEWLNDPSRIIGEGQTPDVSKGFVYTLTSSCRLIIEDSDILQLEGIAASQTGYKCTFKVLCPGDTRVFFVFPNQGNYAVLNVHAVQ